MRELMLELESLNSLFCKRSAGFSNLDGLLPDGELKSKLANMAEAFQQVYDDLDKVLDKYRPHERKINE